MKVKADFEALRRMRAEIKRLPEVQEAVARKAAPAITAQALASFDAGQSVYGDSRPARKDGSTMTLNRTGKLRGSIRFVPSGTMMRCRLGVPYARYQIKHGILPRGGAALPVRWEEAIRNVARAELSSRLGGS